jgi:RHS repeat-associated protein
MNAYQTKTTPGYGYDGAHPSFQDTGTQIFGYDEHANWFKTFNLEASPGNAAKFGQFIGKERDSESGLDYFGARYYGSALGRCTSRDEALADQQPENPQSWNLYGYVRNNPLRLVDDNGRGAKEIAQGIWQGALNAFNNTMVGFIGVATQPDKVVSGMANALKSADLSKAGLKQAATGFNEMSDGEKAAMVAETAIMVGTAIASHGEEGEELGEAASSGAVSPKVEAIANKIEQGGFQVTANPKTPNQTGNLTITHPNEPGAKLNLRSESHPLPNSGGEPVTRVNVETVTPRTGTTPKKVETKHITQ